MGTGNMRKYRVEPNWFGEPEVIVRGDARHESREPMPKEGDWVVLTGGIRAKVEQVGKAKFIRDGFTASYDWLLPIRVSVGV